MGESGMTEEQARKELDSYIQPDNSLYSLDRYISWSPKSPARCVLDGNYFTPDELEAIAWWMRNKRVS